MTESQSFYSKPVIKLHGGDFIIELEPHHKIILESYDLRVSRHDNDEFSINCKVQLNGEGKPYLSLPVRGLGIPTLAKAWLVLVDDQLDVSELFLRYQLDADKLNDNVYLTNTLFNAGARGYSGDDLFVVTYAYLNTLALNNPNFGGVITILCYRIADKLDERAHVLNEVYTTYQRYRDVVPGHNALAFRWLVSSASTLATTLLSTGEVAQAADVVDSALKAITHPSLNPMVHQNYALLLFQGGLIKAWAGDFDAAASLFIAAVNAGRHGITDLLHPQNNWLLGQLSDCHKLLRVVEAAYCAALACTRNRMPPQSRFGQVKTAPRLNINFQAIFDRFECCNKATPAFFQQAVNNMQVRQDS